MRFFLAALLLVLGAAAALAQRVPVIIVPGKPGVPVMMNGVDVSWSVIEGDFGLDRPRGVTPTVIYRLSPIAVPDYGPGYALPGYFPKTGHRPGYGRLEVVPPPDRPLPPPAPTYYRSWSSESDPVPATEYAPLAAPPVDISIYGGRNDRRRGEGHSQGSGHGK
ncbi:MAG TPA: hypothetical protein VK430_03060 [Xanthobacteraceae bacterium]|nr:hypothetical protein [Xanthobacteraceae bacterium]